MDFVRGGTKTLRLPFAQLRCAAAAMKAKALQQGLKAKKKKDARFWKAKSAAPSKIMRGLKELRCATIMLGRN